MPALRATAIVGFGSVVTLGMSVLTMKAYALIVGPDGVGLLALMQSVVIVGVIVTGLGIPTSAIAALAHAISREDTPSATAIGRAATLVGVAGALAGGTLLVMAREPVAQLALGSRDRGGDVLWLAPAIFLSVAAGVQIALLTGHHRIRDVTVVHVGTAVCAAALGFLLVVRLGTGGLAPALLATAIAQYALSVAATHRLPGRAHVRLGALVTTAHRLVRLGLPIAGSQLASVGATFVVPLIVLQLLSATEVGLYRAAAAVSIGYLTFFLSTLTQDYLPRIAAAQDTGQLRLLIERRMRLVMGVGAPIILVLLGIGPWLMEILYTDQFTSAFTVLEWQLVGDLLRLPAWVLAFVLLARGAGVLYFGLEALAGMALLGGTVIGIETIGLGGAGIGYAASQALFYGTVWIVVRRFAPATPGRLQAVVLVLAIASALVIALVADQSVRLALFGGAAVVLAIVAWPRLYRLHAQGEI